MSDPSKVSICISCLPLGRLSLLLGHQATAPTTEEITELLQAQMTQMMAAQARQRADERASAQAQLNQQADDMKRAACVFFPTCTIIVLSIAYLTDCYVGKGGT